MPITKAWVALFCFLIDAKLGFQFPWMLLVTIIAVFLTPMDKPKCQ